MTGGLHRRARLQQDTETNGCCAASCRLHRARPRVCDGGRSDILLAGSQEAWCTAPGRRCAGIPFSPIARLPLHV